MGRKSKKTIMSIFPTPVARESAKQGATQLESVIPTTDPPPASFSPDESQTCSNNVKIIVNQRLSRDEQLFEHRSSSRSSIERVRQLRRDRGRFTSPSLSIGCLLPEGRIANEAEFPRFTDSQPAEYTPVVNAVMNDLRSRYSDYDRMTATTTSSTPLYTSRQQSKPQEEELVRIEQSRFRSSRGNSLRGYGIPGSSQSINDSDISQSVSDRINRHFLKQTLGYTHSSPLEPNSVSECKIEKKDLGETFGHTTATGLTQTFYSSTTTTDGGSPLSNIGREMKQEKSRKHSSGSNEAEAIYHKERKSQAENHNNQFSHYFPGSTETDVARNPFLFPEATARMKRREISDEWITPNFMSPTFGSLNSKKIKSHSNTSHMNFWNQLPEETYVSHQEHLSESSCDRDVSNDFAKYQTDHSNQFSRHKFRRPMKPMTKANSIFYLDVKSFIKSITDFNSFRYAEGIEDLHASAFTFRRYLSPFQIFVLLTIAQTTSLVLLYSIFTSSSVGREMRFVYLVQSSDDFNGDWHPGRQENQDAETLSKPFAKPGLLTILTCISAASLFVIELLPDIKGLQLYFKLVIVKVGLVCDRLGLNLHHINFRESIRQGEEDGHIDNPPDFNSLYQRIDDDNSLTTRLNTNNDDDTFRSSDQQFKYTSSQPIENDQNIEISLSNNKAIAALMSPVGAMLALAASFEVLAIGLTYACLVAIPFGSWLCLNTFSILGLNLFGSRILGRRAEFFHRSGIIFVAIGCVILWVVHSTLLTAKTIQVIQSPPSIDIMEAVTTAVPPIIPAVLNSSLFHSLNSSYALFSDFNPYLISKPPHEIPSLKSFTPNASNDVKYRNVLSNRLKSPVITTLSNSQSLTVLDNSKPLDLISSTVVNGLQQSSDVATSIASRSLLTPFVAFPKSIPSVQAESVPLSDVVRIGQNKSRNSVISNNQRESLRNSIADLRFLKQLPITLQGSSTPIGVITQLATGRRTLLCILGYLSRTISVTLQELIQIPMGLNPRISAAVMGLESLLISLFFVPIICSVIPGADWHGTFESSIDTIIMLYNNWGILASCMIFFFLSTVSNVAARDLLLTVTSLNLTVITFLQIIIGIPLTLILSPFNSHLNWRRPFIAIPLEFIGGSFCLFGLLIYSSLLHIDWKPINFTRHTENISSQNPHRRYEGSAYHQATMTSALIEAHIAIGHLPTGFPLSEEDSVKCNSIPRTHESYVTPMNSSDKDHSEIWRWSDFHTSSSLQQQPHNNSDYNTNSSYSLLQLPVRHTEAAALNSRQMFNQNSNIEYSHMDSESQYHGLRSTGIDHDTISGGNQQVYIPPTLNSVGVEE